MLVVGIARTIFKENRPAINKSLTSGFKHGVSPWNEQVKSLLCRVITVVFCLELIIETHVSGFCSLSIKFLLVMWNISCACTLIHSFSGKTCSNFSNQNCDFSNV